MGNPQLLKMKELRDVLNTIKCDKKGTDIISFVMIQNELVLKK
jgi:hypothetical protein